MGPKTWHSLPEYQALRALMETGTTSEAATRLGLSQSAISRSIASLEARTGRRLFERDGRLLRPTNEASQLNLRLDALFDALDKLDHPRELEQESLQIIAPPTYAHRYLVHHIASFLKANPHFFVGLDVASSDMVARGILDERYDLGFLGVELPRDGVKLTPFRISDAVCVMPLGHPLADHPEIRPEDLDGHAFIALSRRHARRAELEKVLQASHSNPRVVAEVSTSFAAVDLAREGLGLSIVNPFPVVHYRAHDVVFRPFTSPVRYTTYYVTPKHRPTTAIARAFVQHVQLHTAQDMFSVEA